MRPLCFVAMPFGQKPDESGNVIDFDAVYRLIIAPGIEAAGMDSIRADEERTGGFIHKPMFERLILCEFVIADLTTANANVFYELGIRHAFRPRTTVLVVAEVSRLPFDIQGQRAITYHLHRGQPADPEGAAREIAAALGRARREADDSPVFQLLSDLRPADISRLKTDVFREQVRYAADVKRRLAEARAIREGESTDDAIGRIDSIRRGLEPLEDREAGTLVDLLLSYRAVSAWDRMSDLVEAMPEPIARTVLVQEQLAFALNRSGRWKEAERVLKQLIEDRGPSSESLGLLGRVYKDRWEVAVKAGDTVLAGGFLTKSLNAYLAGFEADWRDAYPGVNAVTLMELADPPDPRQGGLLPVVRYAAERRLAGGMPDYWDHATLLELSVLERDWERALDHLTDAVACAEEAWQPETTLRNLRLIGWSRAARGDRSEGMTEIEQALDRRRADLYSSTQVESDRHHIRTLVRSYEERIASRVMPSFAS